MPRWPTAESDAKMGAPLALLAALLVAGAAPAAALKCGELDAPGATFPRGDIVVRYGDPLQIDCVLNADSDMDSSMLSFSRGGDPVGPEFVSVLNETAIRLRIERPSMSDYMYYCNSEKGMVCMNNAVVGEAPSEVEAFSCASENLERLVCEWTPPANPLKTNYTLKFTLGGRGGRGYFYGCPRVDVDRQNVHQCVWTESTKPPYRPAHEHYRFTLVGVNPLGEHSQVKQFEHFHHIVPGKPKNFVSNRTTRHSAELAFILPHQMLSVPDPLVYRAHYMTTYSDGVWTTIEPSPKKIDAKPTGRKGGHWLAFNLTGLEHANVVHDVRLSYKVKKSSDRFWSANASLTFRTQPDLPSRPPAFVAGCFESKTVDFERRNVYVYWRQIEPYEENGDRFNYTFVGAAVDGAQIPLAPTLLTKAYMRFENFPAAAVELTARSTNAIGDSAESSSIVVPAKNRILPEPTGFTKKALGDGRYELLWTPVRHPDLKNYTVFWCDHVNDRPYQCEGKLRWKTVEAGANSSFMKTEDDSKTYQFAISANGDDSSSGMVWAGCTILSDKPAEKMRSVWIDRVGPDFIQLGWKLECSDRGGHITGYNISYCPIVDPEVNKSCAEPLQHQEIPGGMEQHRGNITGLKAYTTYRMTVAVVTKSGQGYPSDYHYNLTSQGVPTPPLDVTVSEIRNDSALVQWKPPTLTNGILQEYNVIYGTLDKSFMLPVEKSKNSLRLENLRSYSNYTISVKACINVCSNSSERIFIRTAIGRPGTMERPRIISPSGRKLEVFWDPPKVPGGTLDVYELLITEKLNDGKNHSHVVNMTSLSYEFPGTVCNNPETVSYYFSVRGVNYDQAVDNGAMVFYAGIVAKNETDAPKSAIVYKGIWSNETFNICTPNPADGSMWIIGIIVIGVIMTVLIVYSVKVLYQRFRFMKDIKPCMPPGLEPAFEKDSKWNHPTKHGKDDKSSLPPFGDAESLLAKRQDMLDRNICERSNCSANTDSTALSMDSNRGSSDEAKESLENADSVQSDTFSAASSLRNIGDPASRRDSVASSEPLNSKTDDDMAPAYCAIGTGWPQDDIKPANNTNSGYVALGTVMKPNPMESNHFPIDTPLVNIAPINVMPSMTALPSGYVMNGIANPAAVQPKVSNGYVTADDPRIAPKPPMPNTELDFSDNIELFSVPLNFNTKPSSDYVKPMTNPDPQKVPQSNGLSVILPMDPGLNQPVLSPEAYCRFGPNTNVPPRFNFAPDIDNDFSSMKDDHEMSFFEEQPPGRDKPAPSSHYVPFKH